MNKSKRNKLERAGFKVGGVQEFLELSNEDMALIDLKVRLIRMVQHVRKSNQLSQVELAGLIGSSQSRVAKMEAASVDVSLDLICKALFAMGVTHSELAKAIRSKRAA